MERFFQNHTVIIVRGGKKDTSKVKSGHSFSLVLRLAAGCTHSLWGCASVKWKKTQGREIHGSNPPSQEHISLRNLHSLAECVRYWSKMFPKMYFLKHWLFNFSPLRFALLVLPAPVCPVEDGMEWHGTVWEIHGKPSVEVTALHSYCPL